MIDSILAADFMDNKRKKGERMLSAWYMKQKKQMREGKW